jgi:hypothetical protein
VNKFQRHKLILIPLVTVWLLLLPGCADSSKPANEPQAKTECEIIQEKALELGTKAANESSPLATRQMDYLVWFNYIIEESSCFDSELVANAKSGIALLLAAMAKQ